MNTKIHIPLAGSHRTMRLATLVCIGLITVLSFGRSFGQQTGSGQSDVPRIMSYQGVISDNNGARLPDGNYPITASLYEDASGVSKIWQGRYTVAVTGGVFTAMLGSGDSPLPELKALNKPIWIGIQVGTSPEMRPLTQLASAPYTLNIPDNSVTKAKMGTDYIGAISINGEKVKGKGAELNITTGDGIKMDFNPSDNSLLLRMATTGNGMHTTQALSALGLPPCSVDFMVGTDAIGWGAGNQVGTPGTPIGFASLLGGWANTASGDYSSIVGGAENTANNCGTFVGGGGIDIPQCAINAGCGTPLGTFSGNTASGISAAVVGGAGNGAVSDLAFVGGGRNNTAGGGGGITQTVAGGEHNQALGDGATICGGEQNTATDIHSSICGGFGNFTGNVLGHQHIGGGLMNRSNSGFTVIGGGANNINNANYSAILGGQGNLTNAVYSAASGFMAVTQQYGQHAQASGQIGVQGDAQTSVYVERGKTTPGVPTNLTLDGGATELVVPVNFSMSLRIEIIARDNAVPANSSSFFVDGIANYLNPGPGACVATGPVVQYNCGAMPGTFVVVGAVAGSNIVRITVNSAAPNVNWVARIQTAEVKL